MGALVSFEVARSLRGEFGLILSYIFVSAHRAPHLSDRSDPIHHVPEFQFLEQLSYLNGVPMEAWRDPWLRQIALDVV